MSDYTPIIDFSATLGTIDGPDLDAEFAAIQTAIATKAEGAGTAVVRTTGTFTPTWASSYSSDPTGDLRWVKFSDGTDSIVILSDDAGAVMTGTSNSTSNVFTNLPSAIRPATELFSTVSYGVNDNKLTRMYAELETGGNCSFHMAQSAQGRFFTQQAWLTTGTKGLAAGFSVMWPLKVAT